MRGDLAHYCSHNAASLVEANKLRHISEPSIEVKMVALVTATVDLRPPIVVPEESCDSTSSVKPSVPEDTRVIEGGTSSSHTDLLAHIAF